MGKVNLLLNEDDWSLARKYLLGGMSEDEKCRFDAHYFNVNQGLKTNR